MGQIWGCDDDELRDSWRDFRKQDWLQEPLLLFRDCVNKIYLLKTYFAFKDLFRLYPRRFWLFRDKGKIFCISPSLNISWDEMIYEDFVAGIFAFFSPERRMSKFHEKKIFYHHSMSESLKFVNIKFLFAVRKKILIHF